MPTMCETKLTIHMRFQARIPKTRANFRLDKKYKIKNILYGSVPIIERKHN